MNTAAAQLNGFGNHFSGEAVAGALPQGRNSPQRPALGLYAEQISGSALTAPRAANRHTWMYRRQPSVMTGAHSPYSQALWVSGAADCSAGLAVPPDPLRWTAFGLPPQAIMVDFVDGLATVCANGDPDAHVGISVLVYTANTSMHRRALVDTDGELLIVPQLGRLVVTTELGVLKAAPGQIVLVPRGLVFKVDLPDGPSRGYVCENHGSAFALPELGPIGSNGLANPRDFIAPAAAFDEPSADYEILRRSGGKLWRAAQAHSPFNVVAWHGNLCPFVCDTANFMVIGSDHPDPSIFTVLTSASDTPGTANCDFVTFPPRWLVMEDTFRPPWFDRNIMAEFMGLVHGQYDAKPGGFTPGGASLHNPMVPHGPDAQAFAKASATELSPHKLDDTLAFMFESRYRLRPSAWAMQGGHLDAAYADCWQGLADQLQPGASNMSAVDASHDPALRSWVASANGSQADFLVQNLPYGRFRRLGAAQPWRIGIAIGDQVLDLHAAHSVPGWPANLALPLAALAAGDLNAVMALPAAQRQALRRAFSAALRAGSIQALTLAACLLPQADAEMALPCAIGDYTDFYTGIHHATAVGKLFRPDNPLLPIGYHGGVSSIGVSGQTFHRPCGQIKADGADPVYAPCQRLDYELELGVFVDPGNAPGRPMSMAQAEANWFGLVLLNDWSARDLQAWEYQPLGPFLAKSFATTISPWIVTQEALAPFRVPFSHPVGDPAPLPHLSSAFNQANGGIAITLEVLLQTALMRDSGSSPQRLMSSHYADAYWTVAQMLAHHSSNGCNLQPGDLLGSGTQSGPAPGQGGSLLELSNGGKQPISLDSGETRRVLAGWRYGGAARVLRARWRQAHWAGRMRRNSAGGGGRSATLIECHSAAATVAE